LSKFLSLYLRHQPEALGIVLEPGGWVEIDALLRGVSAAGMAITREELDEVVRTSDKQRFAIDETGTRIRANQGHSAEVDLQLEPAEPPAELFHGTPAGNLEIILREGLKKMARHHVHLSPDVATATKVGDRRGTAAILVIDAARMHAEGHAFFVSANGVWLVDSVPPRFLRVLSSIEARLKALEELSALDQELGGMGYVQ
jgi:putative RNA 2'-phosphotransferase